MYYEWAPARLGCLDFSWTRCCEIDMAQLTEAVRSKCKCSRGFVDEVYFDTKINHAYILKFQYQAFFMSVDSNML